MFASGREQRHRRHVQRYLPDEIERELKGMHPGRVDEMATHWIFKRMLRKTAYGLMKQRPLLRKRPLAAVGST